MTIADMNDSLLLEKWLTFAETPPHLSPNIACASLAVALLGRSDSALQILRADFDLITTFATRSCCNFIAIKILYQEDPTGVLFREFLSISRRLTAREISIIPITESVAEYAYLSGAIIELHKHGSSSQKTEIIDMLSDVFLYRYTRNPIKIDSFYDEACKQPPTLIFTNTDECSMCCYHHVNQITDRVESLTEITRNCIILSNLGVGTLSLRELIAKLSAQEFPNKRLQNLKIVTQLFKGLNADFPSITLTYLTEKIPVLRQNLKEDEVEEKFLKRLEQVPQIAKILRQHYSEEEVVEEFDVFLNAVLAGKYQLHYYARDLRNFFKLQEAITLRHRLQLIPHSIETLLQYGAGTDNLCVIVQALEYFQQALDTDDRDEDIASNHQAYTNAINDLCYAGSGAFVLAQYFAALHEHKMFSERNVALGSAQLSNISLDQERLWQSKICDLMTNVENNPEPQACFESFVFPARGLVFSGAWESRSIAPSSTQGI